MHLHAAPMRLAHNERQRVIKRLGRNTLSTGQVARPRLYIRLIEGVGRRSCLKHHCIEIQCFERIEYLDHALTLRGNIVNGRRPIDADDCGYPRSAHFAFALCCGGNQNDQANKYAANFSHRQKLMSHAVFCINALLFWSIEHADTAFISSVSYSLQ